MARKPKLPPLRVLLNNRHVGNFLKLPTGAVEFRYAEGWLAEGRAIPISLSLPLREDAYRGETVTAVFENLLPDSDALRRRVAEKVGARSTDAFGLLSQIGRDCVGALQFIPDDDDTVFDTFSIEGTVVTDLEIEALLKNLAQAPLGLGRDREFRISVAGAQEKTALLWHQGQWLKPHGTTPTTHLFKTSISTQPGGIDLSDSVENEYYCLRLMAAFGLPVNRAEMRVFGETKALVVERFDRRWTETGRLLRLPQEDCCQALSISPGQKYQNQGGPGMVEILKLLAGADHPAQDQKNFLKAQILFWLIGATDGHAKNFSLSLGAGGSFRATPLYDVLTAQPSLDARQIERRDMKLAMFAGDNRHYRLDSIEGRHFVQTAERAGLPKTLVHQALKEVAESVAPALAAMEQQLPPGFPQTIHASVQKGIQERLGRVLQGLG